MVKYNNNKVLSFVSRCGMSHIVRQTIILNYYPDIFISNRREQSSRNKKKKENQKQKFEKITIKISPFHNFR